MIQIVIDGKFRIVEQGQTVLEAAKTCGLEIPSLCGLNKTADKVPCDLCVVEVDGMGVTRSCELEVTNGLNITTQSKQLTTHRQDALNRIMADHYADCEAPCQTACPAGVDIQSYLHHIAQNDHTKAIEVIKKTLPMPLSIGRVCPAFCETECRRNLVDDSIAIRQLKRHAADADLAAQESYMPAKKPNKGKSIAIVGSGPGGLTAGYYLSNEGYDVSVYESMPKAGGWLRYGIPEYRLPKSILDKEIELMCRNGMAVECDKKLGVDFTLSDLSRDFDAVCLAVGASQAVEMNYPGSDLGGCYLGVDYLKDYVTDKHFITGKKVAVIGGGNTAIDCARTAVRDGADTTLIYRRTRDEMPAEDYEIEEAEHEGVKFHFLTNPAENIADENGHVSEIRLERMALGPADASGRRSPKPTGEFFVEAFDTVIAAVSQKPDLSFMDNEEIDIPLTRWNTADADPQTMHTGTGNIFSIGDFRRGPATAVEAVGDGRIAAQAIDRFFNGDMENIPAKPFNSRKQKQLKAVDPDQYKSIQRMARKIMPELTPEQREQSFEEVETGFDNADAIAEAARCLECGCQANTDCDLRDYSTEYKATQTHPEYKIDVASNESWQAIRAEESKVGSTRQKFAVDDSSEFIIFDANRCISCGQCIQACREQNVHGVLSFMDQADGKPASRPECRPNFGADKTLMGDSNCVQCGSCIQACPTGAMVDARDRKQGDTDILKKVDTICTYCGVGCKLTMHVDEAKNKIRYIEGGDSPVNEGMLCVKGRFGFDFVASDSRLTTPLIRKDGWLQPASWEEAITLIADKFTAIKQGFGSNALAGFSSAKTTNEDNYAFQKFIRRELGTNNVDHCARLCHASTVTGLEASLGSGAMTNDIPSIKHSDVIFIIGSDTTSAHPIIGSHIKQAVRHNGARLIVADPKRIDIADHAELYLAHRPGTDVMLINGVMQQIIKHGWYDQEYIDDRVDGFDTLLQEVMSPSYSLDKVELVTGVKAEDIFAMARLIGTAKRTAVYYSMGITQHTTGHDNVRSIANLQLLCGNIGIEGGGINPLRGQSNVQGACDMGALPNNLPGYQKVYNPMVRQKFAMEWGVADLPAETGLTLTEIIDGACNRDVRGLYVMGENPVLSDPNQAHVIEGLEALDFLVVQDIFLTETAQYADVVLPSCSFAEKSGHFTNTERRVQRINPAVLPPGGAKEDWVIIQMLANAMGGGWSYDSVVDITNEIARVTPQYGGLRWENITVNGVQWPSNKNNPDGTRIMHQTQFTRGRGQMEAIPFRYAAELPDAKYPLVLTTGRILEQFHTGTMTRKTKGLDNLAGPRAMVSVHDAEALGISNGQMLKVSTRRGEIEIAAFVTKRMQQGVVFIPFHFVESPVNRLTTTATDPHAKIPEFKVAAVRIDPIREPEIEATEA
ncbi:formate dehydrogenase subunit alpha [Vibrio crassostreae]|uniref:formate dehydrogenase subunit alpha n=1 Tax=Vibrio crassostreae TaxID=246167 RepID=UPI0010505B60|nr:formate dehydrogenase subunit alpha [Vibrio crassostreae]TCN99599.1 formate dehydrogenase major subunit [Vibrio crassostreae]CAK2150614.1 formate dehydrogenase major subunit [Vibrio crassostreae]CAK2154576.1 formate dehydrogenase major subunit [Vibrio crassostreae]CAK2180666.1 formate dehydrogenase major subunit [Vibrio crassostreae]CAK2569482.1 formate dehydrogenase major subunit [Vibrio crassostreae]